MDCPGETMIPRHTGKAFGHVFNYPQIYLMICALVLCMCAKSLQSCRTLCDPVDCSSPGSSVHGILQARILESVVMSSSMGAS